MTATTGPAAAWQGPVAMNAETTARYTRALRPSSDGTYVRLRRRAGMLLILSAVAGGTTACAGAAAYSAGTRVRFAARTRPPASAASVLTSAAANVAAAEVARQLFASAPVVVVANPGRPADLATARDRALRAHAPLLLTAAQAGPDAGATGGSTFAGAAASAATDTAARTTRDTAARAITHPARRATTHTAARAITHTARRTIVHTAARATTHTAARAVLTQAHGAATRAGAALRVEINNLHPRAVLAIGVAANVLSSQLPGVRVVTDPAELPATSGPPALNHVAVLVHQDSTPTTLAATTTAQVAGATVVPVRGYDPRAGAAAIKALAAARPRRVLAIGARFGPAGRLASRVAVAATGVQLPGGGEVVFPGRRLVALYGHPGAPALGALGQQDVRSSIARARKVAASYQPLGKLPVVPTFEMIATVAQGAPGKDGNYSAESSVASLLPWVKRATAAGMYVVLDLQPGRANLLTQAKMYERLLRLPNVGLALDPEWKLQPGQVPLRQIGSAGISEINSVAGWLAHLTAEHHLPQKLLVLHQFRLSMIRHERDLDTSHDDLAIVVHMDGQGTPGMKQKTWHAITKAAPPGVFFGWKNFYVDDNPTLTPRETMAKTPTPVMISYQLGFDGGRGAVAFALACPCRQRRGAVGRTARAGRRSSASCWLVRRGGRCGGAGLSPPRSAVVPLRPAALRSVGSRPVPGRE